MSTQAASGAQLAPLGPRLISGIIDGVLIYIVNFIISAILGSNGAGLASIISLIIGVGYYGYCWSMRNGQTLGKQVMGLRVVKTDGTPITPVTALLRYIGYFINTILIFIGWIWIIFDAQHQGFHDKIAGTIVVSAK